MDRRRDATEAVGGEHSALDETFTRERLRIDLTLAGNAREQHAYVNRMFREREWSGSRNQNIDESGFGNYRYEVFSHDSLVFSRGFCTLFEEWRTTPQAKSTDMSMGHSIWMPFPKDSVHVVLYQRVRQTGMLEPMLEFDVDPEDRHIAPGGNGLRVASLHYSGEPARKVDLVFAGEGYSAGEKGKLRADARRMMDYLFSMEPYAARKDDFNIWLVESLSADSGVDIPQDGIWKDTVMDSGYDTFYEDRYLTIWDQTKIADVLAETAFDAVFVIANDAKYGGGGIYNSYALGSSDHKYSPEVFIHEFGHSFAGLGDEYFDSSDPYADDYYPSGVEPWEPNITNRTDFASKWEDMMDVPGVGLYEGAGYMTRGCWRPCDDCRMRTNQADGFCPVCQRAISRMIDFYTK
ncbi:MAG: peptidase M64 [Bacteroidales bacterium]|nr:peptidase M64 [Candidatus Cryptobacteroides choladohippi]